MFAGATEPGRAGFHPGASSRGDGGSRQHPRSADRTAELFCGSNGACAIGHFAYLDSVHSRLP